jgi:hypothetical protein
VPRQTISDWTTSFAEIPVDGNSAFPSGFEPPIYNVWKQQAAENAVPLNSSAVDGVLLIGGSCYGIDCLEGTGEVAGHEAGVVAHMHLKAVTHRVCHLLGLQPTGVPSGAVAMAE